MFFLSSSSLVIPVFLALFYAVGVLCTSGRQPAREEGTVIALAGCRQERCREQAYRIRGVDDTRTAREYRARAIPRPPVRPPAVLLDERPSRRTPGERPGAPRTATLHRAFSRPPPVV